MYIGVNKMTEELITTINVEVRGASSKRPTSLVTRIPPEIKQIMDIEKGTVLTWELLIEDGEKFIKIYKKRD